LSMAAPPGESPTWKMDSWKFYDITHARHTIMNPLASEQLDLLVGAVDLPPGAVVADLGCGKGEFLIRMAHRHRCSGVGIDLSPLVAREARRRIRAQVPRVRVRILLGDGATHRPPPGKRYDLAACVGATWMFGRYRPTLAGLRAIVKPGGFALIGEPFWRSRAPAAYLRAVGERRSTYLTHAGNQRAATSAGWELLHSVVSSPDDFDLYEGLQWSAAEDYARRRPRDPDVPELLARVGREREAYERWGRDCFGWAAYLLRARPE